MNQSGCVWKFSKLLICDKGELVLETDCGDDEETFALIIKIFGLRHFEVCLDVFLRVCTVFRENLKFVKCVF